MSWWNCLIEPHFPDIGSGFNADKLSYFVSSLDVEKLSEEEKNVVLTFDEMKIKSRLVLGNGQLVGFTELGDVLLTTKVF